MFFSEKFQYSLKVLELKLLWDSEYVHMYLIVLSLKKIQNQRNRFLEKKNEEKIVDKKYIKFNKYFYIFFIIELKYSMDKCTIQ